MIVLCALEFVLLALALFVGAITRDRRATALVLVCALASVDVVLFTMLVTP